MAEIRLIDLIAAKRRGLAHTRAELDFIAWGAASGKLPDYQLSAWLMAVCWRSMTEKETADFTRAMASSGSRLNPPSGAPKIDKHSTGGVGDGVSIALAPLLAAAGVTVPMMSGRGLGHTGGTLDKLESIPGFMVRLPIPRIRRQLKSLGVCLFGQSAELAPADRKLYHLRDATATVESLPLVVSSILSKKLSEGLDALVLDVKFGSGAIFNEKAQARELARALVGTANRMGLKSAALLTAMEQPLGLYVGNALEIRQAVEVLQGDFRAADYVECLLALGGWMLRLGGKARAWQEGASNLKSLIHSGKPLQRFKAIIRAQGGDARVVDDLSRLPRARHSCAVTSRIDGFVTRLDARAVGEAAVLLGAGRSYLDQPLDYGAGIILEKKLGALIRRGAIIARLYSSDAGKLSRAKARFLEGLEIGDRAGKSRPVVSEVLS